MKRGALVVFEGCDHSGKTTQCNKLVAALEKNGQKVELFRFPDRTTTIGKMIDSYLSNKCEIENHAIHLLFSANRWERVPKMLDLLNNGTTLVVDRYAFSGVAFTAAKEVCAALHLHDISLVDINWLVKNVTYMPNCYMCRDNATGSLQYHFFQTPPSNPGCPWKLVATERQASGNQSKFDQMLYNSMSLIVDDPVATYPTIDHVWKEFLHVFDVANGLVNYEPIFKEYFYEALNEFNEDNVQYIEVRGLLPETYDLQGKTNNKTWAMQAYANTLDRYVRDHPEFTGGKIIYSGIRIVDAAEVLKEVKQAIAFMTQFPDHFAGYDLVGQEDPGVPLIDYIDALLYPSQLHPPVHLPYFFHAGETDWEGTSTDDNLIDAVLLNTTRIGHGYALPKHPQVMNLVKQHDIAVEVNPISNQVLMLVNDLRNHPAAVLISEGFPVVISADDPSVWGARGLSYDFYMAFMGLMGEDADLKVLKQLAINSLKYSALSIPQKQAAINAWEYKWNRFLDHMIGTYQSNPIGK